MFHLTASRVKFSSSQSYCFSNNTHAAAIEAMAKETTKFKQLAICEYVCFLPQKKTHKHITHTRDGIKTKCELSIRLVCSIFATTKSCVVVGCVVIKFNCLIDIFVANILLDEI